MVDARRSVASPLDVPLSTIATAGTALWAVGLVVTAAVWVTGHLGVVVPLTCVFGVLFGLMTLRWARGRTDH